MELRKRKWGWYLTFWSQKYFKLKFLYFKPGKSISMQRHSQRSETWLFIFGSGWMDNFLKRDEPFGVYRRGGKYEYVPCGNWHQFTADRRTLVLEVQTGLCREWDIERA